MSITPLVSIIIPTYNRAHLINETLNSVLKQTYTNWECIIVDDGSTDNTSKILKDYCSKDIRFQYHQRPLNLLPGGNGARNYGFELSKGEFINWFDDDDVMLENFIYKKINAFKEHTKIVICSGSHVNENLKNPRDFDLKANTYLFKDYVLWNLKIVTNNVMFRTTFLENKKLFDLNILRGQETEFFSRLFFEMDNNDYVLVNNPLFLYRKHQKTKSSNDKFYIPKYKKSQILICISNFERSFKLKDYDLIQKSYKGAMLYFFEALKYKDVNNANQIYVNVLPIIKERGKYGIYLEIKFLGWGFMKIKRGIYKIEKRWRQFEI